MICDFCGNYCPKTQTINSRTVAGIVACENEDVCTENMKDYSFYKVTSVYEGDLMTTLYAVSKSRVMFFAQDDTWQDSVMIPVDFFELSSTGTAEVVKVG